MSTKIFPVTLLICFAIIALNCNSVLAEESNEYEIQFDNINKVFNMCIDKSEGVTSSMLDCTGAAYTQFDALLNKT